MSAVRLPERLQTARLLLRRARAADLAAYCRRIYADAQVMRYLPGGVALAPAQALPRARANLLETWQRQGFGPWLLVRRADRRLIGHCGVRLWPGSDEVELLYALEPSVWGQGLASEAARVSVDRAFTDLGLASLVAAVLPGNEASARLLVGLGMQAGGEADMAGLRVRRYTLARGTWQQPRDCADAGRG